MLAYKDIDKLIGHTPLVRLESLEPEGVEIWAKLEMYNLTGSIKARPALEMIRSAEEAGEVARGTTLLEPTSGNTGIALAALARMRGQNFWAVLPENSTKERIDLLRALEAKITFSPAEKGSNGAIEMAKEIASKEDVVTLDQYANPANPRAHYKTTGPEVFRDLPEITTFVAGLGTGGTLMGAGEFLREQNPNINIVAAEPLPGETVQGLRSLEEGFIPTIFKAEEVDRKILVRAKEAVAGTRALLSSGILAGISGGANFSVAQKIARKGDKIVFIVADGWERYSSTGALEDKTPDWSGWW